MKKSIEKFLEFNGKKVYFLSVDGTWWIAIKPICEALGVHYEHQRELLKKDSFLSELPCHHGVVAADGKMRKMICLPEFYLYGWLFKINSDSPELAEYQWKCYELLYNYFHSASFELHKELVAKTAAEIELEKALGELSQTDIFKKVEQLKKSVSDSKKKVTKIHERWVQTDLFGNGNKRD